MTVYLKDPAARLDYAWDWSKWLAVGETITTHTITVPAGLTLDSEAHDATTVTAWLTGGTLNTDYGVECTITTTQGRTDTRTITIAVRDR